ncbi:MAG: A24 family peptidase [Defluviitaleaceae bacterium]|nr:A24 family peptidase [Defluviitaleaceae bacterium]
MANIFKILFILTLLLTVISYIDLKTKTIPNFLNISVAILGIIYVFLLENNSWQNAILASIAGTAPLFIIDKLTIIIAKKEGFGYGDMKLMLSLGFFMNWIQAFFSLFFAIILASFFAIFLIYKRTKSKMPNKYEYMPFAPFLCAGFLLAYLGVYNFLLY